MYLRECLLENIGRLGFVNVSMPFDKDGTPKPVVLVGRNGSGKTILLSHVVVSMASVVLAITAGGVLASAETTVLMSA